MTIREVFQAGEGILHLMPTWVPRGFNEPGKRLRLHPDDYFALGMDRGAICERWLGSIAKALNGPKTGETEGMSFVLENAAEKETRLFKDYVDELGADLVGEDLMSNMGWPMPELVAYASRNSRIVPGDVLGSGTFGNGGCLGELWGLGREVPALEPGDEVRISFEVIAEIVNIVGDRVPAPELPRARRRPRSRQRRAGKSDDR